jgi:hypothetical protein
MTDTTAKQTAGNNLFLARVGRPPQPQTRRTRPMMTYSTCYTDGRPGVTHDDYAPVIAELRAAFGDAFATSENWSYYGPEDEDGNQAERQLVWRDEATADADPTGANAVAEIICRGFGR